MTRAPRWLSPAARPERSALGSRSDHPRNRCPCRNRCCRQTGCRWFGPSGSSSIGSNSRVNDCSRRRCSRPASSTTGKSELSVARVFPPRESAAPRREPCRDPSRDRNRTSPYSDGRTGRAFFECADQPGRGQCAVGTSRCQTNIVLAFGQSFSVQVLKYCCGENQGSAAGAG